MKLKKVVELGCIGGGMYIFPHAYTYLYLLMGLFFAALIGLSFYFRDKKWLMVILIILAVVLPVLIYLVRENIIPVLFPNLVAYQECLPFK